jgi:hypothetical protein
MARTGRKLTSEQRQAWAAEFEQRVTDGAKVRKVGGMRMVQADNGWFQQNGDACPGKGYDAQAVEGCDEYGKPPRWAGTPAGRRWGF